MNKHSTLTSLFSDIADAIRAKGKTTEQIKADDFPDAIMSMVTVDLSQDTVTAADLVKNKTAHDSSYNQITGTLVVLNYYTGTLDPDDSFGQVGDLYFKSDGEI